MKGFKVRLANEKDALALAAIAEEFMPGEADTERRVGILKQVLKNSDYELLLAELEGEIVGFIDQWFIHDFVHGAKLSYIQNLCVASPYRSKGIGSKLLQEIIKNAKENGASEIHVVTEFGNKSAIELYKKQGLTKESLQLEMEFKVQP